MSKQPKMTETDGSDISMARYLVNNSHGKSSSTLPEFNSENSHSKTKMVGISNLNWRVRMCLMPIFLALMVYLYMLFLPENLLRFLKVQPIRIIWRRISILRSTLTFHFLLTTLIIQCASAQEAARPAEPAGSHAPSTIPVATPTGIIQMTPQEYEQYVRKMDHLPVMTKDYIFGRTIPRPKTDEFGHIDLTNLETSDTPNQKTTKGHKQSAPSSHKLDRLPAPSPPSPDRSSLKSAEKPQPKSSGPRTNTSLSEDHP